MHDGRLFASGGQTPGFRGCRVGSYHLLRQHEDRPRGVRVGQRRKDRGDPALRAVSGPLFANDVARRPRAPANALPMRAAIDQSGAAPGSHEPRAPKTSADTTTSDTTLFSTHGLRGRRLSGCVARSSSVGDSTSDREAVFAQGAHRSNRRRRPRIERWTSRPQIQSVPRGYHRGPCERAYRGPRASPVGARSGRRVCRCGPRGRRRQTFRRRTAARRRDRRTPRPPATRDRRARRSLSRR